MLSGGHSKPCLSPSTCGFAEWWAPRSRPCFRWTRTPSPSITQCPEMFAPRPSATHQSSSSSWSVAQRSCCGPAARAAGEPLGDSLSCHFLCVARRLLAGSQSEAAGLGAGVPAAPLQHHHPGKGWLCDRRAFYVAVGLPVHEATRSPHKDGGWRKDCKMFAASPGQESKPPRRERHVVPIRRSSAPGPLNEHIFMKSEN